MESEGLEPRRAEERSLLSRRVLLAITLMLATEHCQGPAQPAGLLRDSAGRWKEHPGRSPPSPGLLAFCSAAGHVTSELQLPHHLVRIE